MSDFAIIDFEAPGLERIACPIEVGVSIWKPGGPIRTWSSLIWRDPDAYWSVESEAVHHISRDMLVDAPMPILVAAELNTLLAPIGNAHCDGYDFDSAWCDALYAAAGISAEFLIEPMPNINFLEAWRIWRYMRKHGDIPHRAGPDAVRLMKAHAYRINEDPAVVDIVKPGGVT